MSYVRSRNFFGNQGNPYDLSMCFPQYKEEADRIVGQMQSLIEKISTWDPEAAQQFDQELIELIAMHRQSNACPNLSVKGAGHLYQEETQDLLNRIQSAAAHPPTQISSAIATSAPGEIMSPRAPGMMSSGAPGPEMMGPAMPVDNVLDLGPAIDSPTRTDDRKLIAAGIGGLLLLGALGLVVKFALGD